MRTESWRKLELASRTSTTSSSSAPSLASRLARFLDEPPKPLTVRPGILLFDRLENECPSQKIARLAVVEISRSQPARLLAILAEMRDSRRAGWHDSKEVRRDRVLVVQGCLVPCGLDS